MTTALLLARAGHRVTIFERGDGLGGLWNPNSDKNGDFAGENSCKVYQSTYHTAPAMFALIGTQWDAHFSPRHDLTHDWLLPFFRDASASDLAKLALAFARHVLRPDTYRGVSVEAFLAQNNISAPATAWLRATALGGITGTLKMTVWELFFRVQGNLRSIVGRSNGVLHWNAQPPNCRDGFLPIWERALVSAGVHIRRNTEVSAIEKRADELSISLPSSDKVSFAAVFLAMPPRAMARLLARSDAAFTEGFGHTRSSLATVLTESVYEHLGITWFFREPIPNDLPLGGHNVRRGWHPILVQHSQYAGHLPPGVKTVVVGSISLDTDFPHHRLGTRAREHDTEALARILWEDEQFVDPSLPSPTAHTVYGLSNATQIVAHGPLRAQCAGAELFVATSLNGLSPYFTASLESAIQAGAAAAARFDAKVERLPVGPGNVSKSDFAAKRAPTSPVIAEDMTRAATTAH